MKRIKRRPDLFLVLTWMASVAAVLILLWILESIVVPAWPAIQQTGLSFFTSTVWDVNRNRYGALPFLIGTAASSLIALCIALPLGVFIALFLSENFLPVAVRQVIRFVVELLAAIPSVVYGLWGIAVVIPIVQQFGGYLSDNLGFIPLFKRTSHRQQHVNRQLGTGDHGSPNDYGHFPYRPGRRSAHLAGRLVRGWGDPLGNYFPCTRSDGGARNCGGYDSGFWPCNGRDHGCGDVDRQQSSFELVPAFARRDAGRAPCQPVRGSARASDQCSHVCRIGPRPADFTR